MFQQIITDPSPLKYEYFGDDLLIFGYCVKPMPFFTEIKVLVLRDKKKLLSVGLVKVATIMFPIQGELNQERLTQCRSIPIII